MTAMTMEYRIQTKIEGAVPCNKERKPLLKSQQNNLYEETIDKL